MDDPAEIAINKLNAMSSISLNNPQSLGARVDFEEAAARVQDRAVEQMEESLRQRMSKLDTIQDDINGVIDDIETSDIKGKKTRELVEQTVEDVDRTMLELDKPIDNPCNF